MAKQTSQFLRRKSRGKTEALEKYYQHPNFCRFCSKIIEIKSGESVAKGQKRVFCSLSCAAFYLHLHPTDRFRQHLLKVHKKVGSKSNCQKCGEKILRDLLPCGVLSLKKFCKSCLLEVYGNIKGTGLIERRQKGELFLKRTNWQSARSAIQKHARKIFISSNVPQKCLICGYEKHVEVCHIRGVMEFPDDTTVAEINSLKNLVGLCPNHHWEFDNDKLEEKVLYLFSKKV